MAVRLGLDLYAGDSGIGLGGSATTGTTEADMAARIVDRLGPDLAAVTDLDLVIATDLSSVDGTTWAKSGPALMPSTAPYDFAEKGVWPASAWADGTGGVLLAFTGIDRAGCQRRESNQYKINSSKHIPNPFFESYSESLADLHQIPGVRGDDGALRHSALRHVR